MRTSSRKVLSSLGSPVRLSRLVSTTLLLLLPLGTALTGCGGPGNPPTAVTITGPASCLGRPRRLRQLHRDRHRRPHQRRRHLDADRLLRQQLRHPLRHHGERRHLHRAQDSHHRFHRHAHRNQHGQCPASGGTITLSIPVNPTITAVDASPARPSARPTSFTPHRQRRHHSLHLDHHARRPTRRPHPQQHRRHRSAAPPPAAAPPASP